MGLLAGSGRFPITFAEKARDIGLPVVCVGLKDIALPELRPLVHRFHWSGVIQIGRMIRLFKREGVQRVVMAGKVPKADLMHKPWRILRLRPDLRTVRMVVLRAVAPTTATTPYCWGSLTSSRPTA